MKVLLFVLALFAVVALNAVAQEEITSDINWTNIDQSQGMNWTDYSGIKQ